MPTRILLAPAKVNLSLSVRGRRADGYHDIASLVAPVDLCDTVRVHPLAGARVECVCPDVAAEDNLAARAALALGRGARIAIDKRIPAGAGLGGGSSDAAAVLRALGAADRDDLARALGADVPFFLRGGPCWATGTGADLVRLDDLPHLGLVLAWPVGRRLDTREMYAALGRRAQHGPPPAPPRLGRDLGRLVALVANDFEHEAARRVPEVRDALAALRDAGARAATVTGKGPACFGLYATIDEARAAARAARPRLGAGRFVVRVARLHAPTSKLAP